MTESYYTRNRERLLARQKEYNARHKEEKAAYDKARYKLIWKEKAEYNWEYYRRKKGDKNVH